MIKASVHREIQEAHGVQVMGGHSRQLPQEQEVHEEVRLDQVETEIKMKMITTGIRKRRKRRKLDSKRKNERPDRRR